MQLEGIVDKKMEGIVDQKNQEYLSTSYIHGFPTYT